ncbi:MAG: hypothetical protein ACO3DS_08620, partial [Phycisphaerales bacterium]
MTDSTTNAMTDSMTHPTAPRSQTVPPSTCMLWWESFFRSITIMTIIFALTVLWTMATPTIHGAWLDPAAGVAPRTHTAPAADRESDDDGAVVGLVSPDDDSVVAAPSSGIT